MNSLPLSDNRTLGVVKGQMTLSSSARGIVLADLSGSETWTEKREEWSMATKRYWFPHRVMGSLRRSTAIVSQGAEFKTCEGLFVFIWLYKLTILLHERAKWGSNECVTLDEAVVIAWETEKTTNLFNICGCGVINHGTYFVLRCVYAWRVDGVA